MTTGFRVRGLEADTDRISIQSDARASHLLTRRKFPCLPAKWTTIEMDAGELVVIKCNRGAATIEVKHLGGPDGDLVLDDSGRITRISSGSVVRLRLRPDCAVMVRTASWREPRRRGSLFGPV